MNEDQFNGLFRLHIKTDVELDYRNVTEEISRCNRFLSLV